MQWTWGQLCGIFLTAVVSLLLGIAIQLDNTPADNEDWNFRMAESADSNKASFQEKQQSAFVVGYTGEVGKELVKELATSNIFSKVTLLGRRVVEYEDEKLKSLEQKVVDFDKLDEYEDLFKDHDVGFCCLGTTRGKSGVEGFKKVDHDYVLKTAELAKKTGCQHFNLLTSVGANKNSSFLYPRTKGLVESEITDLDFSRLSIYRPSMLLCDRTESRPGEWVLKKLLSPVTYLAPTAISVPTSTVAKAMVNNCVAPPGDKKVEIFENKAIHQISGTLKKK
ncbi:protein HTATIP2-like [Saccoglossus kowalevskii]|uniref:Protein HTATIP2 n=1 Tax=Saccoglossus kowalevskii TaxID=10224 RepID=A0ABM0H1X4_SACKO|nr:PREDICTED: oxidoreductase HTATIP2-like [Saccoglossus kowalevskii]